MMLIRIKAIGFIAIWAALFLSNSAAADQSLQEIRQYIEQKGTEKKEVNWSLSQHEGFTLTYQKGAETHITRTDGNLVTLSWSMADPGQQKFLYAVRKDNQILLQGKIKGQAVDKRIELDDAPWFQATSLSLQGFISSEQKKVRFWTLRPDTLKAYKLKARKVGHEMLAMPHEPMDTVKVELRLAGWLAPFWNSYYWFRAKDGLFVRFEGLADATGNTQITIFYTGSVPATMQKAPAAIQSNHISLN